MNRNEFMQALKAGKVSGAYLFEGVEENIKSVTLAGAGGRSGGAE